MQEEECWAGMLVPAEESTWVQSQDLGPSRLPATECLGDEPCPFQPSLSFSSPL